MSSVGPAYNGIILACFGNMKHLPPYMSVMGYTLL